MGLLIEAGLGALGSFVLRGIFAILKLRTNALGSPMDYVPTGVPINYMSISEFMSLKNRRWKPYILFIVLPAIVTFALVLGLTQFINSDTVMMKWTMVGALVICYAAYDIVHFICHKPYVATVLMYVFFLAVTLSVGTGLLFLSNFISFTKILPSAIGLRDGIWSALFASIVVAWFIKFTNMSDPSRQSSPSAGSRNDFIRQQVQLTEWQYGEVICRTADKYHLDGKLLHAIVTYENLNRPKIVRRIENLLVRLPRVSLTVGVAQIKSDKPLTDEESIDAMGNLVALMCQNKQIPLTPADERSVLTEYNGSSRYADSVQEILLVLRTST